MAFKVFCAILLLIPGVLCRCENPDTFPDQDNNGHRICAVLYNEKNCLGHPENAHDGTEISVTRPSTLENIFSPLTAVSDFFLSTNFRPTAHTFGSVVVKPGCVFQTFGDYDHTGTSFEFTGPNAFPDTNSLKSGSAESWSHKCTCTSQPIVKDCVPEDKFVTVITCDATNVQSGSHTCRYDQTIGISSSTSSTTSKGTSDTIAAEAQIGFLKDVFGVSVGVSKTTNYNWEQASEKIFSQETTKGIEAVAEAGQIVEVDQIVGICGPFEIRTDYYRIKNPKTNETIQLASTGSESMIIGASMGVVLAVLLVLLLSVLTFIWVRRRNNHPTQSDEGLESVESKLPQPPSYEVAVVNLQQN